MGANQFTNHPVNADFASGDDHENHQESIRKFRLNRWWGRLGPEPLVEPVYELRNNSHAVRYHNVMKNVMNKLHTAVAATPS